MSSHKYRTSPLYTAPVKRPEVPAWLVDPTALRVLQHSSHSPRSSSVCVPCGSPSVTHDFCDVALGGSRIEVTPSRSCLAIVVCIACDLLVRATYLFNFFK